MVILNRYKYIIVAVLMIISILSINVIKPKAELIDSINLVNNGNFANGTVGWKSILGDITANANVCEFSISSLSTSTRIQKVIPNIIIGNKYYLVGKIKTIYKNKTYIEIGSVYTEVTNQVIVGDYSRVSTIVTPVNEDPFRFTHRTNVNYLLGDKIYFKEIMIIDLTTTFGAGNEPNLIDCNKIYTEYFEGLKRQDIKPHDVTENAHKTVIQMIVSTMLVPIDMLKSYKVGNQISLFDIFIGMIILVILTKTILKIGGKTSSDIR